MTIQNLLPGFDSDEGDRRKDEGQERVLRNADDFREDVQVLIAELARKGEFTSTELRILADRRGIAPHHPNAWGAAFSAASKSKTIRPTGEYRKSPIPTCHSAVVAVWVAVD